MARSKYAPALFEVINARQDAKSGTRLSLPKWWKREGQPDAPPAEETPAPAEETPPGVPPEPMDEAPEPGPAALAATPSAAPASPPALPAAPVREAARPPMALEDEGLDAPPIVQLRAGRLALSLNPVSAAVMAGVVLIALFTSYQLGRSSGFTAGSRTAAAPASQDEMDRLLNGPAKPEVIKNVAPQPRPRSTVSQTPARPAAGPAPTAAVKNPPAAAPPVVAPKPAGGRHVLIESFKADHGQSAEFAQTWLAEKGYQTRLEKREDAWRLYSQESFEDDAQAGRYVEAMRQIGPQLNSALSKAKLPNYRLTSPIQVRTK